LIIVFFGPKELPVVLRAIHNFFSKLWVYSKEIRTSIESLVDDVDITNQREIKEVEKEINSFTKNINDKNNE
jgi:Sec-independent protein translocase protein TatA